MKSRTKRNRIIASIICILLVISMLLGTVITAFADESKIVTLGVDLSDEQRKLMTNYFNVNENEVQVVDVNNEEEHHYLDGIATPQQIGTHTYSCTYIEPTTEGGIHIKTVNLTWVTSDMIRNALITSGITNCNVICAAPIEVSGTGALTGIFKAYESMSTEELSNDKVNLASQELVQTADISQNIGQEQATTLVGDLKEDVIENKLSSEDDIRKKLDEYLSENNITLTDEQKDKLIQLMLDISKQDYNIDDVKNAYKDIKDTVNEIKENSDKTLNILEKFVNWVQTTWQKITGKYDEISKQEEAEAVKNQLGILADTDDSLLGADTVVTVTEDSEAMKEAESVKDTEDAEASETDKSDKSDKSDDKESKSFLDSIIDFFKGFFGGDKEDKEKVQNTESTENTESTDSKVTFDSVSKSSETSSETSAESSETNTDSTENTESSGNTDEASQSNGSAEENNENSDIETGDSDSKVLNYVDWSMQEDGKTSEANSLDDITR